jgi:transposase
VPAPSPIERCQPRCLLADRAYDSDALRAQLSELRCKAVIPPKSNRVTVLQWDREQYKLRAAVECTFNRLKQARRFATRYEKTLRNYIAVVAIGCALLWLQTVA